MGDFKQKEHPPRLDVLKPTIFWQTANPIGSGQKHLFSETVAECPIHFNNNKGGITNEKGEIFFKG
jgi:hypothetical protein